jgi:hypothetical protein
MAKWISFKLNDRRLKARTDTWEVWNAAEASHLGQVRWFSPWRKYCFFPAGGTVFEEVCLRDLAEFVESQTLQHRKGRRAFPPE